MTNQRKTPAVGDGGGTKQVTRTYHYSLSPVDKEEVDPRGDVRRMWALIPSDRPSRRQYRRYLMKYHGHSAEEAHRIAERLWGVAK